MLAITCSLFTVTVTNTKTTTKFTTINTTIIVIVYLYTLDLCMPPSLSCVHIIKTTSSSCAINLFMHIKMLLAMAVSSCGGFYADIHFHVVAYTFTHLEKQRYAHV